MIAKPPKIFQYDYTIGEDVSSPFKSHSPTEPTTFEATTPWTTRAPRTSTTTAPWTTTTTSTTSTTTETPTFPPKRLKKLSTRKPLIMTRRPAVEKERSTPQQSSNVAEKRSPFIKAYPHSTSTRRPVITTTRTTTTTTTTTATTTTPETTTTDFSYEKTPKTLTPLLNRIRPKMNKNKVSFPDLKVQNPENSFQSDSDVEESTLKKGKVSFPNSEIRSDNVRFDNLRNRNEIISDIYPEDEAAKFPHFPVKKSAQVFNKKNNDGDEEERNNFGDENSDFVDDEGFVKQQPQLQQQQQFDNYPQPSADDFVGQQPPVKPAYPNPSRSSLPIRKQKEPSYHEEEKPSAEWSAKTERTPKFTQRPGTKTPSNKTKILRLQKRGNNIEVNKESSINDVTQYSTVLTPCHAFY